jgi:hypothetical protein
MNLSSLIAANGVASVALLAALVLGWWEAAVFGLVVLVLLNAIVFLRQRQAAVDRRVVDNDDSEGDTDSLPTRGGDTP